MAHAERSAIEMDKYNIMLNTIQCYLNNSRVKRKFKERHLSPVTAGG